MKHLMSWHIYGALVFSGWLFMSSDAGAGRAQVTSEEVDRAIHRVEALAQQEVRENAVPGLAIAVVFRDKVLFARGFGVKDTQTNEPVDADTVFQLASVSKSIGSTVVAELVGEGKIAWDSKISNLDPDFEMLDPWVTHQDRQSASAVV